MRIAGVKDSIAEYLREQIIIGELGSGQRLNEIQLAAAFNISRPPLREAFRALENDRLVVCVPRKGCYVLKISLEELRQLFEARVMIESYAIDLLKQKGVRILPDMVAAFSEISGISEVGPSEWESLEKDERLRYLKILSDFHAKLVEGAGNDLLIGFHQTITYNLSRYQYKYPYNPDSFRHLQGFHKQIIEQIQAGAFDQAKVTLYDHLRTFVGILETKIKEEEPENMENMEA